MTKLHREWVFHWHSWCWRAAHWHILWDRKLLIIQYMAISYTWLAKLRAVWGTVTTRRVQPLPCTWVLADIITLCTKALNYHKTVPTQPMIRPSGNNLASQFGHQLSFISCAHTRWCSMYAYTACIESLVSQSPVNPIAQRRRSIFSTVAEAQTINTLSLSGADRSCY